MQRTGFARVSADFRPLAYTACYCADAFGAGTRGRWQEASYTHYILKLSSHRPSIVFFEVKVVVVRSQTGVMTLWEKWSVERKLPSPYGRKIKNAPGEIIPY